MVIQLQIWMVIWSCCNIYIEKNVTYETDHNGWLW